MLSPVDVQRLGVQARLATLVTNLVRSIHSRWAGNQLTVGIPAGRGHGGAPTAGLQRRAKLG